jgi:hypothetical protein
VADRTLADPSGFDVAGGSRRRRAACRAQGGSGAARRAARQRPPPPSRPRALAPHGPARTAAARVKSREHSRRALTRPPISATDAKFRFPMRLSRTACGALNSEQRLGALTGAVDPVRRPRGRHHHPDGPARERPGARLTGLDQAREGLGPSRLHRAATVQELRVAPPLRRDAGVLRFGSAKARRGAFGGPLIFPQSGFAAGAPAVHPRPVQLETLAAITGLFAQLVEAPRLLLHHRPPRRRRRGTPAARSSKRLRTCSNSRARFLSAFSELAALVFLRLTGTSRVSRAM